MRAQFVTNEIVIGLRRNLTMTIAVVLITAVSLFLVGAGLLLGRQVNVMKGFWYDKIEVTIYLCDHVSPSPNCKSGDVTTQQITQIGDDLQNNSAVQKVYFEDKAEAFKNFKVLFKDSPGLIKNVPPDALPQSYRVKLKNPSDFAAVSSAFQGEPGVDTVVDTRKALDPVFKFLRGFRTFALAIAVFSLAAATMIMFTLVRVSAFNRRRETGIMRLVGASNLYIRLPFLLEGAIAGLVGAVLACASLAVMQKFLVEGVLKPTIKFTPFIGREDILWVVPWLLVIGVFTAAASSFFAIQRHLKV